jgi:hypothetical protein
MGNVPEQYFQPVDSCLDYRSYVYLIDPGLSPAQYLASRRQLLTIGKTNEERMGVVYVRGPWGFFVVPQQGYPKLRVSFFYDTPFTEIRNVMASICAAFDASNTVFNQGDLDE